MLLLKKFLDLYEFEREFKDELQDLTREGVIIVFESLREITAEGDYTVLNVRDYLRFELQVMSLDDVIHDYGYLMDLDGTEGDPLAKAVENFLQDYTFVLGAFEEDGKTFFIFDEF